MSGRKPYMKVSLFSFLAVAVFLFLGAADGMAEEEQGTVTASGGLNLRSGPGMSYPQIGMLGSGQVVTVLERQGSWCRVKDENGNIGWASGNYIRSNTTKQEQQKEETSKEASPSGQSGKDLSTTSFSLKMGIAAPFFSAVSLVCPTLEANVLFRLAAKASVDFWLGGSLAFTDVSFSSSQDRFNGVILPATLDTLAVFRTKRNFYPYLGLGLSMNYYNFATKDDAFSKQSNFDSTRYHTYHGFGFGPRGLIGLAYFAGPGAVLIEGQVSLVRISDLFAFPLNLYVGYRFAW